MPEISTGHQHASLSANRHMSDMFKADDHRERPD